MTESSPERKRISVQQNSDSEPPFEVYHLSHDLRGPLNSILGFTELLLEGIEGPLTDIQKEDIAAINQSAHNLLRLINTMVDVSKLDAGRLDLNEGEVDLKLVVDEVLASDFWVGQAGRISVAVNLGDNLPLVWGDNPRMVQMFEELLAWSKLRGPQSIRISASSDPSTVTAQIHLAGVMVSKQDMDEVFKLITRQDAAGRNHLGPGGLGMPLVRRLAEKQQGHVRAEDVGSGTSFYLTFPIAKMQKKLP
jgi:signal transduction histidine kinase